MAANYLNQLILMDHETGKGNSPPKLMIIDQYFSWNGRFESFMQFTDIRMWTCMTEGYTPPTYEDSGVTKVYAYQDITEFDKKLYEAEKKALSCLKMSLPQDILHLFNGFNTSKELWLALKNHCEGDETLKKNRKDLLKHQYNVFNGLRSENLDQLITRYYHLLAELQALMLLTLRRKRSRNF